MERRERVMGSVALAVAAVLAVVVVVGLVQALRSGSCVVVSSAFVLMAAAITQWLAIGARRRGGRLTTPGFVLLVGLLVVGLVLCGLDFVTGERPDRAFTVLFAAGLVAVVGRLLASYPRSSGREPTSGGTGV
jgi:FtsH-binding integral membrane protein